MYAISQPVKHVPIVCRVKRKTLITLQAAAKERFTTPNKILAMIAESPRVEKFLDDVIRSASTVVTIPAGEPSAGSQQ